MLQATIYTSKSKYDIILII